MLKAIKTECPESVPHVQRFFDGFEWPVPVSGDCDDNGEYYLATGYRKLVFVTDYGLVIRVTPDESVMRKQNPHFMMPLFNRKAAGFEIDIDPGYECPVSYVEMSKIYKMLRKNYGVVVGDGKRHNLCYVPQTSPRFPIVIDLDPTYTRIYDTIAREATTLSRAVEKVKRILAFYRKEETEAPNPQIENYRELREIMQKAWPANRESPDSVGIREFKAACIEFKQAGKLVTPWVDSKKAYKKAIPEVAERYAARLAAY